MSKPGTGDQIGIKGVRWGGGWKAAPIFTVLALVIILGLACGGGDDAPDADATLTAPPTEIQSLLTQASLLQSSGELDPALLLLEQVLKLREEFFPPGHEDIAASHYGLGLLHHRMGNSGQAITSLQRALEIREALNHPDLAEYVGALADLYRVLGDLDQALPLFQRLLAIQDAAAPTGPEAAKSVDILAEINFAIGDYEQAVPYFVRAVEFREKELGPGSLETAQWRGDLARLHEILGNYEDSAKYYRSAVESAKLAVPLIPVNVGARLNDLGEMYLKQESFGQALPEFQNALTVLTDALGSGDLGTVESLRGLGESNRGLGEYALALPFLVDALMIRERQLPSDHPDTATSMGELADLYRVMGNYTQSLPLSIRGLKIWEAQDLASPGAADSLATSLNNLGILYQTLGDIEQAQRLLQRALDIREETRADRDTGIQLATSLNNLAVLHRHTGNFAKSLPLLKRALEILEDERGAAHPDTAVSLSNLADFHSSINQFDVALPLYLRALKIMEDARGIGHSDTAPFLNNLANLYFAIENYDEAILLFQRALEIQIKVLGPSHPETATYMSNLAVLHRNSGDDEKALELYSEALEIRINALGPGHVAVATSLNNLAALYSTTGKHEKALPLFEQALAIREKTLGESHPDTANSLINLGIWYESARDYEQALELFLQALAIEDSVFENIFSVASEEQKLTFAQANQSSYYATLSLINRHFQNNQDAVRAGLELVLARKGIVLNSQSKAQAVIASNLEGDSSESWLRLVALRGDLANLLIRGPGDQDPTGYARTIEDLQAAIREEEQFLARNSSQIAQQQLSEQRVTAKMLADRFPRDVVLVEYVRIRDWSDVTNGWTDNFTYLAFSLTSDNLVKMVDLGNADQIDAKITEAINIVDNPNYASDLRGYARETDRALSDLYTRLLKPLEADLASHQRLIVSPDGEINKVPFVALRPSGGLYLLETHSVSYVASGRDLLRIPQARTSGLDLFLVADATFDKLDIFQAVAGQERGVGGTAEFVPSFFGSGFPPLPGTAREAEVIPPLVRGSQLILKGTDATEQSVLSIKSPRVLHLATHGFFIEDTVLPLPDQVTISTIVGASTERGVGGVKNLSPLPTENRPSSVALSAMVRSGLAFAGANHASSASSGNDGILTALEVTGMDLRGTELVVLSACETAVGRVSIGEGIFGLRRAFVLAGAENLVMSLWLVNDDLTVTQMERFYKGFGDGEPIPEALRQAQLESITTLRGLTQEALGEAIAPVRLWAPFMVQQTGL